MQLNRQQQQQFAQRMNDELNRMTMSWDNALKDWYPIAIKGLDFASAMSLQIPQHKYHELFNTDTYGINMNVVMVLCNNLEARTPTEMGVSAKRWSEILLTNSAIAERWQLLVEPVNKRIAKEFEIMSGSPAKIFQA